jgi:hypothetical protein
VAESGRRRDRSPYGTLFHGKQASVERIVRVVACLAEGLGIRATARVFEVAPSTVLQWLAEAAEQLRAFSAYFLCELHLEQLQLDELYAVLRARKAGEMSDEVDHVLAACGWQINTAFVERLNLSLRQRVAAIGRRSATPCKSEDGLRQQLALFQVYHNFVLPHTSLREALAEPLPINGSGSVKMWRPCTPAMAAGLTDHVWSLQEVLLFRVPPWPQPQTV